MTGPVWSGFEEEQGGGLQRQSVRHRGVTLRRGDQVRLVPRTRADVFDVALRGRTATIQAIEVDYEDQVHLAVVVDDDPGKDLGAVRQPGHCFFFRLDEVEPLGGWRESR